MRIVQSSIVVFAVGLMLADRIAAQTQPAFPDPGDALIESLVDVHTTMLARSRNARSHKLERSKHNTFMTDLLFFTTALPTARRTALIGDVDPTTASAEVSKWIGEFMAAQVARAAAQR